jgi:GAF domain-containing protein
MDEHEIKRSPWTASPDWVAREGKKGFAGHPLIFRGEVLGVLAVFSRKPVSPEQFEWLRFKLPWRLHWDRTPEAVYRL